jgi:hypothetical protein
MRTPSYATVAVGVLCVVMPASHLVRPCTVCHVFLFVVLCCPRQAAVAVVLSAVLCLNTMRLGLAGYFPLLPVDERKVRRWSIVYVL